MKWYYSLKLFKLEILKARDNCMKQSERLLLQVNSFERELTERRNKEIELKRNSF